MHSNGKETSPDKSSPTQTEGLPLPSSNILCISAAALSTWIIVPQGSGHIWIDYVLFTAQCPGGSISPDTQCKR